MDFVGFSLIFFYTVRRLGAFHERERYLAYKSVWGERKVTRLVKIIIRWSKNYRFVKIILLMILETSRGGD